MIKPGDVLHAPNLGLRFEIRRTAAETGGELTEFDVVGRPRGFVAAAARAPRPPERFEVIEGSMTLTTDGRTRILGPGETAETPPGTVHRHFGAGPGPAASASRSDRPARVEEFLGRPRRHGRRGRDHAARASPSPCPARASC